MTQQLSASQRRCLLAGIFKFAQLTQELPERQALSPAGLARHPSSLHYIKVGLLSLFATMPHGKLVTFNLKNCPPAASVSPWKLSQFLPATTFTLTFDLITTKPIESILAPKEREEQQKTRT